MQYHVHDFEENSIDRTLDVTVSVEEVKTAYNAAFKKISQSAKVDGFRKGHIPKAMLLRKYLGDIIYDVQNKLITSTVNQALQQAKIESVGTPEIDNISTVEENSEFTYTMKVQVYPHPKVENINEVAVTLNTCDITEEDIDYMILSLRKQNSTLSDDEAGVVTDESVVNINFVGLKDGVEFQNGSSKNFDLDIKSNRMIPGFAEAIVGHKKGEEFDINVTFPDTYHVEELKGQPVVFKITINNVQKRVLPEVTVDFCKRYDEKCESVEDFRKCLRDHMIRESNNIVLRKNIATVNNALLEKYGDFASPKALIERAAQDNLRKTEAQFGGDISKLPPQIQDHINNNVMNYASRIVRTQILIQEIIDLYKLPSEPDAAIKEALINEYANAYDNPDEFRELVESDSEFSAQINAFALDRTIYTKLFELLNVTYQPISFADLSSDAGQYSFV